MIQNSTLTGIAVEYTRDLGLQSNKRCQISLVIRTMFETINIPLSRFSQKLFSHYSHSYRAINSSVHFMKTIQDYSYISFPSLLEDIPASFPVFSVSIIQTMRHLRMMNHWFSIRGQIQCESCDLTVIHWINGRLINLWYKRRRASFGCQKIQYLSIKRARRINYKCTAWQSMYIQVVICKRNQTIFLVIDNIAQSTPHDRHTQSLRQW